MKQGFWPAAVAAALLALPAQAQQKHDSSGASTATVEIRPDGAIRMSARNTRFIPYTIMDEQGEHPLARLATVITDVKSRSDAEGVDPASSVNVTIEDLSGASRRQLATFTDRGSEGRLVDERYFVATTFGCCGGLDRHIVHATETGKLLFHSTGSGEMGRAGWVEMPNARPALERWAAFDGDVDEAGLAKGIVGTLAYGSKDGPLLRAELHLKAARDELIDKNLELGSGIDIAWIDGKQKDKPELAQGDAGSPASMWIAEAAKSAQQVGGFTLVLRLGRTSIATIPIAADRPVLAAAKLAPGYSLAPEK
jgi:hypothetical protein